VKLGRAWLADNDRAAISAAFHEAHRATYGHANEDAHIWLKELRAHVVGEMPKPRLAAMPEAVMAATPATRSVRLLGRVFTASVTERSALRGMVTGPAIINQMDTTTLVPPGWHARRIASGALVLERTQRAAKDAP
jgi:N-methylhydantoinase A